jgi:hypothetical protein
MKVDLGVEHFEHPSEWFIFDDLEWPVALANPESSEISKFAGAVG